MTLSAIQWHEKTWFGPITGIEYYSIEPMDSNTDEQPITLCRSVMGKYIELSLTHPALSSSKNAPIFYNNFIRREYNRDKQTSDINNFWSRAQEIALNPTPTLRNGDSKFVDKLVMPFNGAWYYLRVGKYIIGRNKFCNVKIPLNMFNSEVSYAQCVIIVEKERVIIVDYWSKNGTRVQKINRLDQQYDANSICDEMSCPSPGIRKPIILDRGDPFFELDVRTEQFSVPLIRICDIALCQKCLRQQTEDTMCDFIEFDNLNIFCAACLIEHINDALANAHVPGNIITINEKNSMVTRRFGRITATIASSKTRMSFKFAVVCDLLRRHDCTHLIEKIVQMSDGAKSRIAMGTKTIATTEITATT